MLFPGQHPLQKNAALLRHGEEKQDATLVDPISSLGGRCALLFILVAASPRLKCNLTLRCAPCLSRPAATSAEVAFTRGWDDATDAQNMA